MESRSMPDSWEKGSSRRWSVSDSTRERRPRLKALIAATAQERRRQDFISNQKKARRDLSHHARLLAGLYPQAPDSPGVESDSGYPANDSLEASPLENEADEDMDCDTKTHAMATAGHITPDNMNLNVVGKATSELLGSCSSSVESGRKGKGSSRRNRGGRGETGMSQQAMKRRDHWANQLCTPEWMLTVPSDLNGAGNPVGAGWYVMARPEGKRVLVISSKGETVARQMGGAISHRFSSNLPGGSTRGRRGGTKLGGYCILDCVFHELDETFFVLDMMAWKGYPLYDCHTDFRFFWVQTKLREADGPLDIVSSKNAYRIKPTPYHECDRQGLAHAYSSPVPFIKDGLLFHLKAAHYQLGPTPLVLLWKDNVVTRYLGVNGLQAVVLRVGDNPVGRDDPSQGAGAGICTSGQPSDHVGGERSIASVAPVASGGENTGMDEESARKYLLTCDGVCLGEVGHEGSPNHAPQAKPGELLRFTLTGAEEELVEHPTLRLVDGASFQGTVHGLRFQKRCSMFRPMADSWSKVLFQARLRRVGGVGIDEIIASCITSTGQIASGASFPLRRQPEEESADIDDEDDML